MLDVKKLRVKTGLSQQELAEKTGIPKGRINNWEQGKGTPKADDFKVLSDFFDTYEVKVSHLKIDKGGSAPREIPFYDAVAVGGLSVLADQSPVDQPSEMIDPGTWFRSANGALRVYGHSMFPKYPAGCIIAFKEADKEVIMWGEDYVLELSDRRVVKRLEKGQEGYVKAVSYNKSEEYQYAPVDIPVGKIKRLYMVLGKIELETSI